MKKMCGIFKTVTTMKKIMKPFVLVAAAAMALASCQKNEMHAPEKQELHFTIKAGIETKTSITDNGDGTYSPSWKNGDQIGIFFTEPKEKVEKVDATFSNTTADGPEASFEGRATVEGEGTFYAFYPASAFNQHYGDETIRLDLPAAQKPTSTSFDPACDIIVAKPCYYISDGDEVLIDDLYFARLMSVLKINLKGEFAQGEVVESLTFSVDGVDITGNAKVDYKTATIKGWNNGSVDRNVVTASYSEDRYITIAEGNNAAYLVVAPTTIPAGTSLSFTLKTANYNISKTVSAPSDMTFTAGNLSVLNLTINEENCEANDTPIDYSGVYLIAGKEGDKWYAAKKYTSGNYLSVSEIEFIGENIVETETISDHYMTIDKVADGPYKGMYTIVDAGGKYLSAVSGDDNYLKAVDAVSDNTYWSIEKDEEKGTYSIVASKSSDAEKNHMRFNYNNGTNSRVTCYGSTSTQPYLTLFSTSLVKPDTTPKITVTNTSYSALAEDTSLEIPYTVKNITGNITATVASGATMSNVSTNVTTDKVTVSFAANKESAEKNATIVLSYEGAQSQEVVITQAAAGVTKQYYVKVTTAPTDWSGTYLIVFDDNKAHATVSGKDFNATSGALTINEGKIEATSDLNATAAVTISKNGAGYSILLPNGTYLKVSSSNTISNATPVANYISFVANTTQKGSIRISGDANFNTSSYILYHQSNYFRCYTNKLSTSNYYLPDLYRLEEGGETPEPDPDPTPDPDPEQPGNNVTLSVDFESSSYSEWSVINMLLQQSGITAKGGSYYGTTGGKTTASITTKKSYTYPNSITCYVSKTSNNTTNSSWKIQVSLDGSTWTDVKTQSAVSMSKGEWVEFTADLSSYSNVYVRVAYSGTSAVRAIDNLTFTYTD